MTISIVSNPDYFDFAELLAEFIKDQRTVLALTNSVVDKCNEVVTREVDDALDSAGHPFQALIREQEEELQAVYTRLRNQEDNRDILHEVLVNVARTSSVVLDYVNQSKKINAIKELRRLTNASLRATKEAVEDPRVRDAAMFVVVGVGHVGTD